MKLRIDPTDRPRFVFCRSAAAGFRRQPSQHIRELAYDEAPKLGGGIISNSLCGRISSGWDLDDELTDEALAAACPECVEEHRATKETT